MSNIKESVKFQEHTIDTFIQLLKVEFRTVNWFFFTGLVNGKLIYIKVFPDKREVYVQRFIIEGKDAGLPRNYEGKRATLAMIKEKLMEVC